MTPEDTLAAEARQLAIYARQTTAYKKDPVFRSAVNELMKSTQFVSDRAVDELLADIDRDVHRNAEPVAQKPIADKGLPTWLYFLVGALAAGSLVAVIAEVMAWWRVVFGRCHL